jgi:hypothetical protein
METQAASRHGFHGIRGSMMENWVKANRKRLFSQGRSSSSVGFGNMVKMKLGKWDIVAAH